MRTACRSGMRREIKNEALEPRLVQFKNHNNTSESGERLSKHTRALADKSVREKCGVLSCKSARDSQPEID